MGTTVPSVKGIATPAPPSIIFFSAAAEFSGVTLSPNSRIIYSIASSFVLKDWKFLSTFFAAALFSSMRSVL